MSWGRSHLRVFLALWLAAAWGCGGLITKIVLSDSPPAAEGPQGELVGRTRYEGPSVTYEVGELPAVWEVSSERLGDTEFFAKPYGAVIASRSVCKRYTESPLDALARDMLSGLSGRQIVSQGSVPFAGREGYDLIADGKMDGVPVRMWVRVLKKNNCIFDFTLVAPPEKFEKARGDFEAFLAGVKTLD